jgi:hypothetical protein
MNACLWPASTPFNKVSYLLVMTQSLKRRGRIMVLKRGR